MDYKDKKDIQINSLAKLLKQIGPFVDKAQDDEWEAKGWQKGFMEFLKVLEQVNFKAGYKQGVKEGLEKYQKDLMAEIELQTARYDKLIEQNKATKPDTHPDERTEIMKTRTSEDTAENKTSRKSRLKAKKEKE
jgi:hypothetical protein